MLFMRQSAPRVGAVRAALVFLAVGAVPVGADHCMSAKLTAVAKKESSLLRCQAAVAATGKSSGLATCEGRVVRKFNSAFAKAGSCAGSTQTQCEANADGCDSAMAALLTDTFPSKCESDKRKAAATLTRAELLCYSRGVPLGPPQSPCITKAQGKFRAALTKAGGCADGGSPLTAIENACIYTAAGLSVHYELIGVCPAAVCAGGTFLTAWGSESRGYPGENGTFFQPLGIAVDGSGNVFVADWGNGRIQKFDNSGAFLTMWGIANPAFVPPDAVAVDGSGNVFVIGDDPRSPHIVKFTNTGTLIDGLGDGGGSGDGQFIDPSGVAVDGSGNVFVADTGNNRIDKFDNTGTFLLTFGWGVKDGAAAFEICTSGCQTGNYGFGDGRLYFPLGVAVDGSGNVFVADSGNSRVQEFDNTGSFLTAWGGYGTGDGEFEAPTGIAVDASGSVFVTDNGYNRIQKFTNTGTFVTMWGSLGSGNGQFNGPYGVTVDGSGNVFVVDVNNNRIEKFGCPL